MHACGARALVWQTTAALVIVGAAAIGSAAIFPCHAPADTPQSSGGTDSPVLANPSATPKLTIPLGEVRNILACFASDAPPELASKAPAELESAWSSWVARHHARVRERLDRGDLDSIVNYWMYGTTFTRVPRVTAEELRKPGGVARAEELLLRRLSDFIRAIVDQRGDVRLRFAREVIERRGIDLSTSDGQDRARLLLAEIRNRTVAENVRYRSRLQSASTLADTHAKLAAYATAYHDRGLSSDTSMGADFALATALKAVKTAGTIGPGAVRRVAIVGPGLDFTDKAEGNDLYPPQTVQPFALIDSLVRLELSLPGRLQVVTFDVSQRVNEHIEEARQGGAAGRPYMLHLSLDRNPAQEWTADLVHWWEHFGAAIGDIALPLTPPSGSALSVRAVRVRPSVAGSIVPRHLDIAVERLASSTASDRFDLIVATNVLVYYSKFEQALALANIAHMLRPGGLLLTNYVAFPAPPMEPAASLVKPVMRDRQGNGDTIFAYQRLTDKPANSVDQCANPSWTRPGASPTR